MDNLFDFLLAVQKSNGGGGGGGGGSTAKVLWEGDVSTTPQEFIYEFNPITCDYYFNDELYTNIMWQPYDGENLYTVEFGESQAMVGFGVMNDNDVIMATSAGHLKIVEKTNKCLMINAIYQSDQYTIVDYSFYDIFNALDQGYIANLRVNGLVSGADYTAIGDISVAWNRRTETKSFVASVQKDHVYFSWTVNGDGSIVGTIDGGVSS